jgi:hypothetical protein
MIRSQSSRVRALPTVLALAAATFCWTPAALAQTTPTAPAAQPAPAAQSDVRQLTDEERLAILDGNTVESAARARGEAPEAQAAGRGIHGEVGMAVGTNGMRALYGTADIPLGDHAAATVSFESSRYGPYRR